MQLYHYRSIESALAEIGDGTFHFASRDELNDPIEGFLRVYWQGDKSAWEGLFRTYDCSDEPHYDKLQKIEICISGSCGSFFFSAVPGPVKCGQDETEG